MELGGLIAALAACVLVQAFFAASEIAMVVTDESKLSIANARDKRETPLLARAAPPARARPGSDAHRGQPELRSSPASVLTTFLHHFGPNTSYLAPRHPGTVNFADWRIAAQAADLPPSDHLRTDRRRSVAPPGSRILAAARSRDDSQPLAEKARWRARGNAKRVHHARGPVADDSLGRDSRSRRRRCDFARRAPDDQPHLPLHPFRSAQGDGAAGAGGRGRDSTFRRPEAAECAAHTGFSRLPVYEGSIVNIVGVVHVFDLLEAPDLSRPVERDHAAGQLLRRIDAAGRDSGRPAAHRRKHGGGGGRVWRRRRHYHARGLLEEMVGEIEDEYDEREELARVVDPRTLTVSARATLSDLNERFGLRLPESDGYATIGGLVVERLGHIPRPGEQLAGGRYHQSDARRRARRTRPILILDRPLRMEQARQPDEPKIVCAFWSRSQPGPPRRRPSARAQLRHLPFEDLGFAKSTTIAACGAESRSGLRRGQNRRADSGDRARVSARRGRT